MLISELDYVNKRTANLLKKLKIETVEDLLLHYPRRYEEHPMPIPIASMRTGEKCSIYCKVERRIFEGKNGLVTLYLSDDSGQTSCKWFHATYIGRILEYGSYYVFSGVVNEYNGKRYLMQPSFMKAEEYRKIVNSLTPVYPLTKGLTNENLFKIVKQYLLAMEEPKETLPNDILKKYSLISKGDAIRCIHYPANERYKEMARRRIVFEEFYDLIYSLRYKSLHRGLNYYRIHEAPTVDKVLKQLPYKLTASQEKAITDIRNDFEKELIASRLVQGDVGSGKTLVALLSLIIMADNHFQSALMAPTEVLATQHYRELCELLDKAGMLDAFEPVLLTGSIKEKEKNILRKKIAEGKSRIIVGTHAIIQEKVKYKDLALVIIDEQHRFGVEQRDALAQKGNRPVHTIIMTATPIPRTTGNIIFGAMDISIMTDKPAGRSPIVNYAINDSEHKRAYDLLYRELCEGHQAYIICPMVTGDDDGKKSVEETAKKIRSIYNGIEVGEVHGKMDPKKKNEVMEAFAGGGIKILVSTTVVEVGVNVPNATVILIEGANNFGMLQLHQLRGRVGRGKDQSYCVFINTSDEPCEKLNILARTNDGFEIAEADYNLRKAGDLLGTQQSGSMGFRLADIVKDEDILKQAEEAVKDKMAKEK